MSEAPFTLFSSADRLREPLLPDIARSPSSPGLMRILPWYLAVLLAAAHPLAAQTPTASTALIQGVERESPRASLSDPNLLLIGGLTTDVTHVHPSGGVLAMYGRGGWGAAALGMAGRGGGYDSGLAGGAATRRLARGSAWNASVFAGYGIYGERGRTEIERAAGGLLAGTVLVLRAGPVGLAGVLTHMTGTYDGPDVTNAFRFHVPRISIGIAF